MRGVRYAIQAMHLGQKREKADRLAVRLYRKFRFPLLNKFPKTLHPGRLASLPLICLPERSKLVQDALPLLCDLPESGIQFFIFHILRQRQRLFHQHRLFRRQGRQPLAQGKGINPATLEQGKYSAQYALSELLVCGECGTPYKRCTWARNGKKRIVWRCVSRVSSGFCQPPAANSGT